MFEVPRRPNVRRTNKRKLHSRGQHTDYGVRRGVQSQGLADHVSIAAEAAMPKRVADHDHQTPARLPIAGEKSAPQLRLDSHQLEKSWRYSGWSPLFRFAAAGQVAVVGSADCHGRE